MRSATKSEQAYGSFWADVGVDFPSLKGAPSTRYYAECEQLLLSDLLGDLKGKLLFKTDLWDEAKNSEILLWAAEQRARVAGVDLAPAVVVEARRTLAAVRPAVAGADIRALPYPDDTFDLIYSMGTIEHFYDYQTAIDEIYRVLKPGGRAVIGVPNLFDPFLRPLMVAILDPSARTTTDSSWLSARAVCGAGSNRRGFAGCVTPESCSCPAGCGWLICCSTPAAAPLRP